MEAALHHGKYIYARESVEGGLAEATRTASEFDGGKSSEPEEMSRSMSRARASRRIAKQARHSVGPSLFAQEPTVSTFRRVLCTPAADCSCVADRQRAWHLCTLVLQLSCAYLGTHLNWQFFTAPR